MAMGISNLHNGRRLDVLISTYGRDGIERVSRMGLPAVDGVTYIVSWQIPVITECNSVPKELSRQDIEVYPTLSRGLSRNRNNALRLSRAEYCLIADDDLEYTSGQLRSVIDTFDRNPDVELATFRYSGNCSKKYPSAEVDLMRLPKNYFVASVEIAFRRKVILGKGLKFNVDFGIGAPILHSGEDGLFLLEARRAGIKCRFFPIVITRHCGLTTGSREITDIGVIMAEGAYIWKAHGYRGIPRLPLYVWRNWRNGRLRFWWGLRGIIKGYSYGMKV